MRTFERTHPWITFHIDLRRADPAFWIAMGEAASKCEHLSRVPLRPDTSRRLHAMYLAKGAAATTAIEGNSLSEADVLRAVEGTLEVPPSKAYLKQEVDNIIEACRAIGRHIAEGTLPEIDADLVCRYNRAVLDRLPDWDDMSPGRIRGHSVVVGSVYRGAPAEDCAFLLDRLCAWLNGPDFRPPDGSPDGMGTVYAILRATVAHLYLAWIHPFGDGNGRTARLLEFHVLLSAGVPSPAVHLLSNHYNQTRSEYYRQLDLASKSGGDVLGFLRYAVGGFVDGLRSQLEYVWEQQWDVAWTNYVHEQFQHQDSAAGVRRRHLALDLGAHAGWVPAAQLVELTPRLAKGYARSSPKTVQRDLNELEKMGLVVREAKRVRARREVILQFLPLRRSTV